MKVHQVVVETVEISNSKFKKMFKCHTCYYFHLTVPFIGMWPHRFIFSQHHPEY